MSKRRYAACELAALVLIFIVALGAEECPIWWLPPLFIGLSCLALALGAYYQGFSAKRGAHFQGGMNHG